MEKSKDSYQGERKVETTYKPQPQFEVEPDETVKKSESNKEALFKSTYKKISG